MFYKYSPGKPIGGMCVFSNNFSFFQDHIIIIDNLMRKKSAKKKNQKLKHMEQSIK